MTIWRFTQDVRSDDPAMTQGMADKINEAVGDFLRLVMLTDAEIEINKDDVHQTVHQHVSTVRRACDSCVQTLAYDERN